MQNKPDSNNSPEEDAGDSASGNNDRHLSRKTVHGDEITMSGDIHGPVVFGRGTINIRQWGGDGATMNDNDHNNAQREELQEKFTEKLEELQRLIVDARRLGELDPSLAEDALVSLQDTVKLVRREKKPPREKVVRKLSYVSDLLDTAVDLFSGSGGVVSVLSKAIPITSFLVKIAARLF